jgi:hypothetical protein
MLRSAAMSDLTSLVTDTFSSAKLAHHFRAVFIAAVFVFDPLPSDGMGVAESPVGTSRSWMSSNGASSFCFSQERVISSSSYTESLPGEQKQTAAAFWRRAHTFFTAYGITVKQVLTDIQSGCAALRLARRPAGEDRCRPAPARHRCLTEWSARDSWPVDRVGGWGLCRRSTALLGTR